MGKVNRRKGPRRAYLKRFSSAMVNGGTGPTPNREVLAGYGERAQQSWNALHSKDRAPERLFSEDERFEALWQGDWKQGLEHFNKINLSCGRYGRVLLYFRGQAWVFVREDEITKIAKSSITYSSRDRAMRAYNLGKVCWIDRASLPPPG